MEKKQGFLKKFLVVMIAVFSLTLLSPEVATQLGTMQTVQAAVKISSKSLIMVKGQKKTLKLKGTKKKAKWSSSKKSVATVSSKGVVVGKKKGITVITAKVGSKKYTCKVTVETPKLNKKSVTINVGKTYQLQLTGTRQKISWSSNNQNIVTVSNSGVVLGKKAGKATISAKIGGKVYCCTITVKSNPTVNINLGELTGRIENVKRKPDYQAEVILIPLNGSAKELYLTDTWDWAVADLGEYNKYNIYAGDVYVAGTYTIKNINPGKYVCLIKSDYYDGNNDTEDPDLFDSFFEECLSKQNINYLREYVSGYVYNIYPEIVINPNKTTKLDEYFWHYDAIQDDDDLDDDDLDYDIDNKYD